MSSNATSHQGFRRPSFAVRIGQALRRYFVTGLATLIPVAVTIWILVWLFNAADNLLGRYFGSQIPGLGLVATLLLILAVGFFTVHLFGRVVLRVVEVWFNRLPIARRIYPAVKQLTQFLFGEKSQGKGFRRTVLVQYPRPGIYSMAFVTNEITVTVTGMPKTLLALLIPQPPSPVTGPIIFVPEEEVVPLDLSVEDAAKLIMSGGIVAKPLQAPESPAST